MSIQTNTERAADNQSSGAMLIIVGIIGIIGDIAVFTFNPFNVPEFNRFLTCGVMLALFILFLVMGVLSLKTYKILTVKAQEESSLLEELQKWCDENLTTEKIDVEIYELENADDTEETETDEDNTEAEEIMVSEQMAQALVKESENLVEISSELEDAEDVSVSEGDEAESRIDEALFFARTEAMKKLISDNFINLDEDLLDSFVDDYYIKLYDNQEKED